MSSLGLKYHLLPEQICEHCLPKFPTCLQMISILATSQNRPRHEQATQNLNCSFRERTMMTGWQTVRWILLVDACSELKCSNAKQTLSSDVSKKNSRALAASHAQEIFFFAIFTNWWLNIQTFCLTCKSILFGNNVCSFGQGF